MSRQNICCFGFSHSLRVLLPLFATLFCLLSFISCNNAEDERADLLNDKAYYHHYRSLDSVKVYADSVLRLRNISSVTRAEALNNLVFYYIGRMKYETADSLIHEIYDVTDNQIELCLASIQMMRMCQRKSDNKRFYEYRQKAQQHFHRIYEDLGSLSHYSENVSYNSSHPYRRLIYAESEYRLVLSVYDYYAGQTESAAAYLREMDSIQVLKQDTVQYVAYLYNIGSGGILTRGSKEDILHQELEHLLKCFVISTDEGYTYWKANAIQSLSEHLLDCDINDLPDISLAHRYLNTANTPDSLIAGVLAEQSLNLFHEYGDLYQEAASWRTLAYCYSKIKDYPGAIYSLEHALNIDPAINEVPSLKASFHEQFSIAFSALDEKQQSDYHRNKYLDLYDDNRQDKELEARIEQLDSRVSWLRILLFFIIFVVLLLIVVLAFLILKRRAMRRKGEHTNHVATIVEQRKQKLDALDDQLEETRELCAMKELELSRQQEMYAEQRAKVHIINTLTPLIDRMLHETKCLKEKCESPEIRENRCDYISELLSRINQQNNFLTEWIQMKRGELSLRIESFALADIFDILSANTTTIKRQGLTLNIVKTDLSVKADRTLTLFMLNTLCDNASKFTPKGGTITIYAEESDDDMVEISVKDTGVGMTEEQKSRLFEIKPITDEQLSKETSSVKPQSHGFGLLNSKGIIEKYKKTNSLFKNCVFDVESSPNEGSRFFFRLPRGIQMLMLFFMFLIPSSVLSAPSDNVISMPSASALADSVYSCNISARYSDAIDFAKHYLSRINDEHRRVFANTDTLMLNDTILAVPAEMRWLKDSVNIDYRTLISVRNEVAVAALALHDWPLYHYNNNVYIQLYKEMSIDHSLSDYYKQMAATEVNSNVAVVILVLLILSLVPIYYFTYYRYVIIDVRKANQRTADEVAERELQAEQMREQLSRLTYEYERLYVLNNVMSNSLSALKHETMYYPSRLQQLLLDVDNNTEDLDEVARYYRSVYSLLSNHAQHNARYRLPAKVLADIMLRLMAQLSGQRRSDLTPESQERYFVYGFLLKDRLAHNEAEIKLSVLTLVVRDIGELYDMRRCGVNTDGKSITVIVPKDLKLFCSNKTV